MREFLITKRDRYDIGFGISIRRKDDVYKAYSRNDANKVNRFIDWNVRIELFVIDLDWNFSRQKH